MNIKKLLQKNSLLKDFLNYFTGRILAKGVVFISIPLFSKILNPTDFGVNHEGSILTAKRLVEEAKDRVAHAVKFQSYKAETLDSNSLLIGILQKNQRKHNLNYLKNMILFGKMILG